MLDTASPHIKSFLNDCVAIDIEHNPSTSTTFKFAAVKSGSGGPTLARNGSPGLARAAIMKFFGDHRHVIGHNILRHDLPLIEADFQKYEASRSDEIESLQLRDPIDTLWLNPLAFPHKPYHKLDKTYQTVRHETSRNNPEEDARETFNLLREQIVAFGELNHNVLAAYHSLCCADRRFDGFDRLFTLIRGQPKPDATETRRVIARLLAGLGCINATPKVLQDSHDAMRGWSLAYVLSWLAVAKGAGADTVVPTWVRKSFPNTTGVIRRIRDTDCLDPACRYCTDAHDPEFVLKRWLNHDSFRAEPTDQSGHPLQRAITGAAMRRKSVLGILPTGTGKSVCYQIPAMSRYEKTGALTVVFSPLTALMTDQIEGMKRSGISNAVTVNGLLSLPERHRALEAVALGGAAIVLIAPEQLRSKSVTSALAQREVAFWAIDEAHCLSKWGHDFRTDYRYITRFIKEVHMDPDPQVVCLTATAKPDVIEDIVKHFQNPKGLGLSMDVYNGGAERTNLTFETLPTTRVEKKSAVLDIVRKRLPDDGSSGAIVYHSTKKATEETAEFLAAQGLKATHFHAGVDPDEKRAIQNMFQKGELSVVVATNAFGMGIDKPNVRLVVHADIPGSLENYLQEAGRAGRDNNPAWCVLLNAPEDIERQFQLAAQSQVGQNYINSIRKGINTLNKSMYKSSGEVVATSGEILRAAMSDEIEIESASEDTPVKTAVSWLESADFFRRDENRPRVFPSFMRSFTIEEIRAKIAKATNVSPEDATKMRLIAEHIWRAPKDAGISTDTLCGIAGVKYSELRKLMGHLERIRVLNDATEITVFIDRKKAEGTLAKFKEAKKLEAAVIDWIKKENPRANKDSERFPVKLTRIFRSLKEQGLKGIRPDVVMGVVVTLAKDGWDHDDHDRKNTSLSVMKSSHKVAMVKIKQEWDIINKRVEVRSNAAEILINHFLKSKTGVRKSRGTRFDDTLGGLMQCLMTDIFFRNIKSANYGRLLNSTMLWLHDREVVTIGRGMTVFRPAMTIRIPQKERMTKSRSFTKEHYRPLDEHYDEKNFQIHVMDLYGSTALESQDRANEITTDYFEMQKDDFVAKWFPGRLHEIKRRCTPRLYMKIVEGLSHTPDGGGQRPIVEHADLNANMLVLAGPGSGKTHVIVHRAAHLIKVLREDPKSMLIMAYNRHAADEIRHRLHALIVDSAGYVRIGTMHSVAMYLIGESFTDRVKMDEEIIDTELKNILIEATNALNGKGLDEDDGKRQRKDIIQGYRWMLVDEYQDVGPEQYEFIKAIAGREALFDSGSGQSKTKAGDHPVNIFAVGDDDQNIYSWNGASVEFIRKFKTDFIGISDDDDSHVDARVFHLKENYRSTANIIEAANAVIERASKRMKVGHPILVDSARQSSHPGGVLANSDNLAHGRVQVLTCPGGEDHQALAALNELIRLKEAAVHILPNEDFWKNAAVIARNWKDLDSVRDFAHMLDIPVDFDKETLPPLWRMREMEFLTREMRRDRNSTVTVEDLQERLEHIHQSRWTATNSEGLNLLEKEFGDSHIRSDDMLDRLCEWSRGARTSQTGLRLLTAHSAKCLEFSHVAILDGDWTKVDKDEDPDASRRLFNVAMTRAKHSLTILRNRDASFAPSGLPSVMERVVHSDPTSLPGPRLRHVFPTLEYVNLGYAGFGKNKKRIKAIESAQVGDDINMKFESDNFGRNLWILKDIKGRGIGRMAI